VVTKNDLFLKGMSHRLKIFVKIDITRPNKGRGF
jgi:hypothetical protein